MLVVTLYESRLNAILYNTKNYFGLYGKYNIDVSRSSNDVGNRRVPSLKEGLPILLNINPTRDFLNATNFYYIIRNFFPYYRVGLA